MHSSSCDFRRSECHGQEDRAHVKFRFRRSHWTGSLASSDSLFCKTIKNPGRYHFSSRKHVTCRVECREVKGCHSATLHWPELIPKYEALNSEKISDTVKITLALQNVRGNLAQSLNVSVSESTSSNISSQPSHQLLEQCSRYRDQEHLSTQQSRQERVDQLCQDR